MYLNPIGRIAQIIRYPIKSFAGEYVNESSIETYGLYGDRSHALIDPNKEGFAKYITAREMPELLSYRAEFSAQSRVDGSAQFPEVVIHAPDGTVYRWNEQLLSRLQCNGKRNMSLLSCRPDENGLLAVDAENILIITDRSVKEMEQMWGKLLDMRRFRPNLVISLSEDKPFSETEWISRHLLIGSVKLYIQSECERCVITTIHPDTLAKDKSLLRAIQQERNQCFGVYASVRATGTIHVGDAVSVI